MLTGYQHSLLIINLVSKTCYGLNNDLPAFVGSVEWGPLGRRFFVVSGAESFFKWFDSFVRTQHWFFSSSVSFRTLKIILIHLSKLVRNNAQQMFIYVSRLVANETIEISTFRTFIQLVMSSPNVSRRNALPYLLPFCPPVFCVLLGSFVPQVFLFWGRSLWIHGGWVELRWGISDVDQCFEKNHANA